jgi:hypothetical protein
MGHSHNHWLGLQSQGSGVILDETNQLQALIDQLPDPGIRYPSLLVLIGQKKKRVVLKALVPSAKNECMSEKKQKRPIQLLLEPSTIFHERPLLYADCPLPVQIASNTVCERKNGPHIVSRSLQQIEGCMPEAHAVKAVECVYSRLLKPFADVFCLFYEDFGSFDSLTDFLASLMEKGQTAAIPVRTHPSLMLVVESDTPGTGVEIEIKAEFVRCLSRCTTLNVFDHFSDIEVVAIFSEGELSSQARLRRLKERLLAASNQAVVRRLDARMLFSATHFAAFFRYACDHFAATFHKPFDFVNASRLRNPISPALEAHLPRFLRHFPSSTELLKVGIPVLGSALLLDAYPPDMHGKSAHPPCKTGR